jgi:hypothetical protein
VDAERGISGDPVTLGSEAKYRETRASTRTVIVKAGN